MIDHIEDEEDGLIVRGKLNTIIDSVFLSADIPVSLPAGEKIGPYVNGDIIPATGKTPEQVFRLICTQDIPPSYTPAILVLSQDAVKGEVGAAYANRVIATFTQMDAGLLTKLKIQKDGDDIGTTSTISPLNINDTGFYIDGETIYVAKADYLAGGRKNYLPSNTIDARAALVRNTNAPQAAETEFSSNVVRLPGSYKIFYGPAAAAPANSADIRAAAHSIYADDANTFILDTGIAYNIFFFSAPSGTVVTSVKDLTALNATITSSYLLSSFPVNDGGGNPVPYDTYIMTNSGPYVANHQHQITI